MLTFLLLISVGDRQLPFRLNFFSGKVQPASWAMVGGDCLGLRNAQCYANYFENFFSKRFFLLPQRVRGSARSRQQKHVGAVKAAPPSSTCLLLVQQADVILPLSGILVGCDAWSKQW